MKTKLTVETENCRQEKITKKIGKEIRLEKLEEYRDKLNELYDKYQIEAYLNEDIWNHHNSLTSSIFKLMMQIKGIEYKTRQEEDMENYRIIYVKKDK